jgi:hypothetical protein
MEGNDLLLVGAEVSVAFAGFSGIIATYQFNDEAKIKRGDVVGLTMIVQFSLQAALFCVIPMLLSIFQMEEAEIWTTCSLMAVISMAYSGYSIDRNIRGVVKKASVRLFFGLLQLVNGLIILGLILNATDLVFHREAGPYITAIVWSLGLVGYMFGRLLLRPLWILVRKAEAKDANLATMR